MINHIQRMSGFRNTLIGEGVLNVLKYIKNEISDLRINGIDSGEKFGSWTVPKEWRLKQANIRDSTGKTIVDTDETILSVVQYSSSVSKTLTYEELTPFLHYLEELPDAIPYITSYYKENWGFCLPYNRFKEIDKNESFKVDIDSELVDGKLYFGEFVIKGRTTEEVLISTYICHPEMANNELSGPVVAMELAKFLMNSSNLFYSYRFIFIPETIGSIAYINKNLNRLKENTKYSLNLTCIGDERSYSRIETPYGNTELERLIDFVSEDLKNYKVYSWLRRQSDERQFNSPGVELNTVTLCRSKFGEFEEYHTSLDRIGVTVTEKGLTESFNWLCSIIDLIEINRKIQLNHIGEPFMTAYDLYPTMSLKKNKKDRDLMNFISYCDGKNNLVDIARRCNISLSKSKEIFQTLKGIDIIDYVQ